MIKLLKKIFKYGALIGLIIGLSTPFWGIVIPWNTAEQKLRIYGDQTPILVGFSYRSTSKFKEISRKYVLFPSVLNDYKSITVSQLNNGQLNITEQKNGAFFYLLNLIIFTFLVRYFWSKQRTV